MALATGWSSVAALGMLLQPRKHIDLWLPALGAVAAVFLLAVHFALWQTHNVWSLPDYLLMLSVWIAGMVVAGLPVLWLSEGTPQLGFVPVGALGLLFFDWGLRVPELALSSSVDALGSGALNQWWHWLLSDWGCLGFGLGFWSGLFSWPQLALFFERTHGVTLRRNFLLLLALFPAAWALGFYLLAYLLGQPWLAGLGPYQWLAISGLAVTMVVLWQLPIAILQFGAWVFIRCFYRIRGNNLHLIPETGAVLLVCNHVSFIDSFVIGGTIKRPPRFVMDKGFYQVPILNWVFRTAKAIPIAPAKQDPELLQRAYERIEEELLDGQVVLVFPEGAITWDGEMVPFKDGVERIIKRTPVRVVPIALRGLWGSWFSRSGGGTFKGWPRPWKKIELRAGEPIAPENVTTELLQQKVQQLRGTWQ